MPRFAVVLLVLAALIPRAAEAVEMLDFSGTTPPPVRYRDDAVRVLLTEDAASRLRAAAGSAQRAPAGRIGLSGLDREAASLGAILEREFPDLPKARTGGIDLSRHWIARVPLSVGRERALAALRMAPEVAATGTIAIVPVVRVPNDSMWTSSYHWFQSSRRDVHAPEAWDLTLGDATAPVAILDTGILPWHPDITGTTPGSSGNLWINTLESEGIPGIDDDGNGYIDDVRGWDFVDLPADSLVQPGEDWRDEDNDPNDYAGHGTAVAGVVGAITNNTIGATGAAWNVRVMALRVGWSGAFAASGEVDLSYAARAIVYAALAGSVAINISFATVPQDDLALAMTVATRLGSTLVLAAGNNGSPHAMGARADVISVAATDPEDQLTRFSNRGDYVDVAAPGLAIATTSLLKDLGADSVALRRPDYTRGASGTSFSAPVAAGAVALLQSWRRDRGLPWLPPRDALLRLVDTADDIAAVNPGVTGYGSGRLNFWRMLTDPPTSFTLASRAIAAGAPALLPTQSGATHIVFATTDGRLLVADGTNGETLLSVALPRPAEGAVAVADLGEGRGVGFFVVLANGTIAGYDEAGRPLPGWPVLATAATTIGSKTPALADVTGDGLTDVVWGGNDGYVYAWHVNGESLEGFPLRYSTSGRNILVALADLDGIAGSEIIAVTPEGGIHVLHADGSELPGWPQSTNDPDPLPPIVTTLGTNPTPCIVVPAAVRLTAFTPAGEMRWRRSILGPCVGSPAAGDLDGDGFNEIVIGAIPSQVVALDSSGVITWSSTVPGLAYGGSLPLAPAIGTRADGRAMVLFSTGGSISALDGSGASLPGFPRPGTGVPAIADLDRDSRIEIVVASNPDSVSYVYDGGVGSWNPLDQRGWPTDRGNAARTGSNLTGTARLDDVPPNAITDAAGVPSGDAALLTWSAPRDPGAGMGRVDRYELRYALTPIDEEDYASAFVVAQVPAPAEPGAHQFVAVAGLEEQREYWFALKSVDRAGNVSALSNEFSVAMPAIPPAAIADLAITGGTDTSLALRWTATGDDGHVGRPTRYRIRVDEQVPAVVSASVTVRDIEHPATQDAGGRETAVIGGLRSDRRYGISVYAQDEGGRVSAPSNVVSSRPGPLAARTGFAVLPGVQPARPPMTLHWQIGSQLPGHPVRLDIVDVTGRLLRTLALGTSGDGVAHWDGHDGDGRRVPSGVYFARLAAGPRQRAVRLVVLW